MKKITIGSRGSDLALWQANYVKGKLEELGHEVEIHIIKTQGDRIQHLSLDKLEGKGFFTKEIEDSLLSGEVDLAVHSHKDLPTENPPGLKIAAVSDREDASELILVRKECVDATKKFSFKENSVVGTSSARRKSQLLSYRPDAQIKDIRGNVPTRINKLRSGDFDAILIAAAGVKRLKLDLSDLHVEQPDKREFIPAPAQGVLALQIREDDKEMESILAQINVVETANQISVERKVLNLLEGGCHLPLGSYCINDKGTYKVWTAMAETWDAFPKRVYLEGDTIGGMAETILQKLKNNSTKSVFITRDLTEDSYFKKAMDAYTYPVHGNALITIEPIAYGEFPETDWIFFSSKHGVTNFFKQSPKIGEKVRFGVTGLGTEGALRKHGHKAVFVGQGGDMELVGQHFSKLCEGESVLFPQPKKSNRTIQKQLSGNTTIYDLHVYDTERVVEAEVPETEVAVLTSPTNAEVYLKLVKNRAKYLIAIGTSTAGRLDELGVTDYIISNSPEEVGLGEAVFSL